MVLCVSVEVWTTACEEDRRSTAPGTGSPRTGSLLTGTGSLHSQLLIGEELQGSPAPPARPGSSQLQAQRSDRTEAHRVPAGFRNRAPECRTQSDTPETLQPSEGERLQILRSTPVPLRNLCVSFIGR